MAKKHNDCISSNRVKFTSEMMDYMMKHSYTCPDCHGTGWEIDFKIIQRPLPCQRCGRSGIIVVLPSKECPE